MNIFITDNRFEDGYKVIFIEEELRELGFNPQTNRDLSKEKLSNCFDTINQIKAARYIEYFLSFPIKERYYYGIEESMLAAQSMLLSCCMGESNIQNSIEYLYYAMLPDIKDGTECAINPTFFLHESLIILELYEYADKLFDGLVRLLEDEVKSNQNEGKQCYHIYSSLIELAEYAGLHKKIEHYKKMQQEVMGLGFIVE